MPRRDLEYSKIFSGQALNVGNVTTYGKELPMATGYLRMNLRINIALTVGTGTTPINEGELFFIKKIYILTDAGEVLCNLPGAALFEVAHYKAGTLPRKTAIAAADGTYSVNIPIWFIDNRLIRPYDTILDTSRYNQVTIEVTLGTVADLLGTVGTSSVTATLDLDIEHTSEVLPPEAAPLFHVSYENDSPVDANVSTVIEIARSTDLTIKRFLVKTGANGTPGVPFSGQRADDVIDTVSIEDHNGFIRRNLIYEMIQDTNKIDYSFEAARAGIHIHDLVSDRSISTALFTGDKAKLEMNWINKSTVAGNDIVTLVREGHRVLKG